MREIARRSSLAAAVAALALACGGEETKPAGGAPAAATPARPAASAATAPGSPMAVEDMYEWDAAKGAEPDLAVDSQECQSQITGQGLAGVAQHIECMRAKGWRTRQPGS
jgi:hypothetical protein